MAGARFKTTAGVEVNFDFSGLGTYIERLANVQDQFHKTILSRVINAGIDPIMRLGRTTAPKGYQSLEFRIRGERFMRTQRLASTMHKKSGVFKESNIGWGRVGSRSGTAPHGHLVSGGTGAFINSPLPKRSRRPRRGTRNYVVPPGKVLRIPVDSFHRYSRKGNAYQRNPIGGYIFIRGSAKHETKIENQGSRPNPWNDVAQERAAAQSKRAMAATFGVELIKAFNK